MGGYCLLRVAADALTACDGWILFIMGSLQMFSDQTQTHTQQ